MVMPLQFRKIQVPTGRRINSAAKLTIFAQRLLNEWRRLGLPTTNAGALVAVSGGADSTALLLALNELAPKYLPLRIVVVHLDHGLRKRSSEDAKWVQSMAAHLGNEVTLACADVKQRAKETADNLEQAARRARYDFFARVADHEDAQLILTAHTLDDQAETVLLRLLRGSGADGLAGIGPVRPLSPESSRLLVRPLVTWARRADTESYCRRQKIRFRVDEMNDDERFARVRVRKQLVPLLESFNGRIVETIARTSELLREDSSVLNFQADLLLREASNHPAIVGGGSPTVREGSRRGSFNPTGAAANKSETTVPLLNVNVLAAAPIAVRRRALRKWIAAGRGDLRRFELVHLTAIEKLLAGNHGGRVAELPGGALVARKRGWLELVVKKG